LTEVVVYADNSLVVQCKDHPLQVGYPGLDGLVIGRTYYAHMPENKVFFKKYRIPKERNTVSHHCGPRDRKPKDCTTTEVLYEQGDLRVIGWPQVKLRSGASALSNANIRNIRKQAGKVPQISTANEYDISRSTVSGIQRRRIFKDVP